MAFENCIAEIVSAAGGKISDDEAGEIIQRVYDRALKHQRKGVTPAEAPKKAAAELAEQERITALVVKRQALINRRVFKDLMARSPEGKEAQTVKAILSSVEGNERGLADSINTQSVALIDEFHGGLLGELREAGLLDVVKRRNKAFERDLAVEMWRVRDPAAKASGNAFAEQAAKIFHRWLEAARKKENDAGAFIGQTDHYVARQTHNARKIRGRGPADERFAEWRDYIEPLLDEDTFEGVTNREAWLRQVWNALATGYHSTRSGSDWIRGTRGEGNIARRLSHQRKLHFKDGDSWFDYNERYGQGNVVDSTLRALEHAGRNTALMRVLGTNPEAMFDRWINKLADRAQQRGDAATVKAVLATKHQRVLDTLTGRADLAAHETLANIGRGVRIAEAITKLGFAAISSFSDIGAKAGTLRWNGVPLIEAYANGVLAPLRGRGRGETRAVLDLFNAGNSGLIGRLYTQFGTEDRFGTASKLINTYHRWNFLSYWTDSHETGLARILSRNLARNVKNDFGALPGRLQVTLRRYAIEEAEWNAIRQVERRAADGKDYVVPGSIYALPDEVIAPLTAKGTPSEIIAAREQLRTKLGGYFSEQLNEAMSIPDAAARTMTNFGTQTGTYAGEAARLLMQFKQFPITFVRRSVMRELKRDGVDVFGVGHLLVSMALLGYTSLTASELLRGRSPRDIVENPLGTLRDALLKGGFFGLYGDLLLGEAQTYGGGLIESFAGPTAGTIQQAYEIFTALQNGGERKSGGEKAATEAVNFIKSNTPYINLFWLRAAVDHFIIHRLQEAVNPGYLQRLKTRLEKENGQTFWLPP